jgi:ketosteroid isomerase-like protein
MSQENVEIVRRGFDHFQSTGDMLSDIMAPEFVWDMSKFSGWREQQIYEGIDGARRFIADWSDAWDDRQLDVEAYHDAGDRVVAVARQRGQSRTTGLTVEMSFALVFTVREDHQTRMEMYSDPAEAVKAMRLED